MSLDKLKKLRCFVILMFLLEPPSNMIAQSYFAAGNHVLYKIDVDDLGCSCSFNFVASTPANPEGTAISPNGILYYGLPVLRVMDTINGNSSPYFTPSGMFPNFAGLVSMGGGIFYTM